MARRKSTSAKEDAIDSGKENVTPEDTVSQEQSDVLPEHSEKPAETASDVSEEVTATSESTDLPHDEEATESDSDDEKAADDAEPAKDGDVEESGDILDEQSGSEVSEESEMAADVTSDDANNDTSLDPLDTTSASDDDSDAKDDEQSGESEESVASDSETDLAIDTGETADEPKKPPESEVKRGAGAGALFFGGLAAGAVGFAAAYYGLFQQPNPTLDDLVEEVGTLQSNVAALSDAPAPEPDLSPVTSQLNDLSAQLSAIDEGFKAAQSKIDAIETRLDSIESAAVSSQVPESAQKAFEEELNAAKDAIAAERKALADMIAESKASESDANDAAQAAKIRTALSQVVTAVDTGEPFSEALSEIEASGVEIPAELTQVAENGVASLTTLQQEFPDAARAALAEARSSQAGESGFSGFLKTQLGVRSLEPREGNDPDAVLSRAEASLQGGLLAEALTEIEALPSEAQLPLSDWIAAATSRRDAESAAQALSASLN
ncbi:MAG: hypothetical protein AAGF50_06440 [Pseudomonadota bacterium]